MLRAKSFITRGRWKVWQTVHTLGEDKPNFLTPIVWAHGVHQESGNFLNPREPTVAYGVSLKQTER